MTWKSFIKQQGQPNPVDSLPIILCGPMLRRVESNSISVFLVLKKDIDVKLVVYKNDNVTPGDEYHSKLSYVAATSASGTTYNKSHQIGTNCYVVCLTATTANIGPTAPPLVNGQTYFYDILFMDNGSTVHLKNTSSDEYLKGDMDSILYKDGANTIYNLPSFVLPNDSFDKLKILHGSCRKPHGYSEDAMGLIDGYIDGALKSSTNETTRAETRPQMLALTGDQIYADDVSSILLKMIIDANYALMGWHEDLSGITPNHNLLSPSYDETQDIILQGKRGEIITRSKNSTKPFADFSVETGVAQSHLMKFGEFVMMYIFCWSDSLWQTDLPTFEEVAPGRKKTKKVANLSYVGKTYYTVRTGIYSGYISRSKYLSNFLMEIPKVKRLLANIPTYMILDDHEVTDDLFFNLDWVEKTIENSAGNSLGKRIIQNGLSAYNIFQNWGNDPSQFNSGNPGDTLLTNIKNLVTSPNTSQTWINIAAKVLPTLLQSAGQNPDHSITNSAGTFKYNFVYQTDKFEILFLDTRTNRAFRTGSKHPYLINFSDLDRQIVQPLVQPNSKITILVTPSPVFGHTKADSGKKNGKSIRYGTALSLDMEDWEYCNWLIDMLMSRLIKREPGFLTNPSHAWKAVILSGDVHYGFTKRTQLWVDSGSFDFQGEEVTNAELVIGQLCASSFKNETGGKLGTLSQNSSKPNDIKKRKYKRVITGPGTIRRKEDKDNYGYTFRVDHVEREKKEIPHISLPSTVSSVLQEYKNVLQSHSKNYKIPDAVVGFNNFGELRLETDSGEITYAYHKHYYLLHPLVPLFTNRDIYANFNEYKVSLKFNEPSNYPKP